MNTQATPDALTQERRAKWRETRRRYSNADDPEVVRQREGVVHTGKSRCWVLTERGQALVDKWEREGR